MSEASEDKVVPIKTSAADLLRAKITEIAAGAGEVDRNAVSKLVKRAENSGYSAEISTLTPGMCALLFLFHNSHNRPWSAGWSEELARRMKAGAWKQNSMSAGFYKDGLLEDGQHRLAAAAISGTTWTIVVVFGVEQGSVDTIDGGRRRSGADHALLDGIADPSKKQAIVKTAANYFVRSGNNAAALRSEAEVKTAIEANDALLVQAIEIGAQSRERVGSPQLKESTASAIAYIMMKSGWPMQSIREKLAYMQQSSGSTVSDNDPFFVTGQMLIASRAKTARGEKLTTNKEIGYVLFTFIETERGVKALQKKRIVDAVKKSLPDPRYPIDVAREVAA
jgi:hypothetical protein